MRKLLLATAALLVMSVSSNANFIEIGVALDGGAITTVGSGGGTAVVNGASAGNYTVSGSATGSPPLTGGILLDGNTIDVGSTGDTAVLHVFVTETGQTSPLGLQMLLSSFTQNLLTTGWTVQSQTFADPGNAAYGMTISMGNTTFTVSDAPDVMQFNTINLGAGPYSLTEEFTITSGGIVGQTNNTTDISAVPGPVVGAGLPGLISLFGGGWWYRRRRKLAG